MSDSLRFFVALAPPPATRRALVRLRNSLALQLPAKPVVDSNLHMTLVFLGQTPRDRQSELLALLQDLPPLSGEFCLDTLDAFSRAGVIWAGCSASVPQLEYLALNLRQRLVEHAFSFDQQAFRAHVTLFRKATSLRQVIDPPIRWPLTQPQLYASISTPDGPAYRPIHAE